MEMNTQRVLIVQDASKELCAIYVKHVLREFSLKRGDKIRFLGIIQAFAKKNNGFIPKGCGVLLKNKTHSSRTIHKHKEDIKEETRKTAQRYSKCAESREIVKIAEALQVEFEMAVEAGLLKEVAVEYAKSFHATHVILHRQVKKEIKYFTENLSCGISRMKFDKSIKIVRPSQANEVCLAYTETREEWTNAFINHTCSICMNRSPHTGPHKKFTYAELQLATNGFCAQNLMHDHGRKIYFGLLNDQRKVTIRKNPSCTIKDEDFKREIAILEGVKHENVAFFIGHCLDGPHVFLVYEYVCDGSLNKHLSEGSKKLTWDTRLSIAFGAAKGLEYLHGERIYGSMRPCNVLLTHDFQPLISYYGIVSVNRYEALGQSSESSVIRTFEYLAPEYEETGIDLSKADVYSFGVVLLELITGRKTKEDTHGQSFLRWARPLLREKKYSELIDPLVQDSVDVYQLYWLVRVADKCLSWDPKKRYSMRKVVTDLSDIINRCGVEDFSPTESEL
ncbi:hypothetical protein ABFS83_10G152200 [Erythranthe nasuta]